MNTFHFDRFIALGDSFTEGMCDEVVHGHFRGWADRVADVLATQEPSFTYLNLAVRGKKIDQVLEDQLPVARQFITGQTTLLSFHAGANDVLRPRYEAAVTIPKYQASVREIAKTGCTLLLFTVAEKATGEGKTAQMWEERFSTFNRSVREVASEVGAVLVDWNEATFLADRRFLATDRLHLNEEGHHRVAQGVLEELGYPFDKSWRTPLPPEEGEKRWRNLGADIRWFVTFALPWIWRRVRGKSSGDGRSPKYREPVRWPISR